MRSYLYTRLRTSRLCSDQLVVCGIPNVLPTGKLKERIPSDKLYLNLLLLVRMLIPINQQLANTGRAINQLGTK